MDERSESVERVTRGPSRGAYAGAVALLAVVGALLVTDLSGGEATPPPPTTSTTTTTAAAPPPDPRQAYASLQGPTGLTLVVGGTLVDVDRDQRTWVGGLDDRPQGEAAGMELFQIGADTVIVRYFSCEGCGPAEVRVLVLPEGETRSRQILADDGIDVARGRDGIWVVRRGVDSCTASQVSLDGTRQGAAQPIRCGLVLRGETALGLLADGRLDPDGVPIPTTYLLDPVDLSIRHHARRIVAVSGDELLSTGPDGYELRPIDGAGRPVAGPAPPGDPVAGATSPDGRYAVVGVPGDAADLWVADLVERRWLHVPLGPTTTPVRLLAHDWATDGRLVMFGPLVDGLGDRDWALATWRPGDERVAVRPVDYPPGALVVRSPS